MVIRVDIPADVECKLRRQAELCGRSINELAVLAIRRGISAYEREQQLAPIRQAFATSGMTEDEAVELFEHEKHALRRERREPAQ